MNRTLKFFAILTALCLLAGCAASIGQPDAGQEASETLPVPVEPASTEPEEAASETPEPTASGEPEEAASETPEPTASGEPEGWEEEWPAEYPVETYRLLDGAIAHSGRLNKYRYTQLDGAENYMNLAADYVREALDCGEALSMEEDSPHDGYANWFMEAPNGTASVSGSSITGRFCFSLYPAFARILEMTERTITDRDAMEQAARSFVNRFSGITGELTLLKTEEETQYYHDERSSELRDVTVPAIVYCFRSATVSEIAPEIQDGRSAPIACGDSTIEDLNVHCFAVTVWPDGTVVRGDNYITRAQLVSDGTARMLDESDLPELMTYMSSYAEHDTLVVEGLRADGYNVYFGSADVEPVLTLTYYFESDPSDHLSTEFVTGLFGED